MATFALIHGAGDVGWSWHLVEAELRRRGHDVVAPDLPCDDDSAGLSDYADTVVDAIGDRRDLAVVGHSYGGYTATLVADRLPVDLLVLVAGMIPVPGESPARWWDNTGYAEAMQPARQGSEDTGDDDPLDTFYHDVPRPLAEEAMRRERGESNTAYHDPWPLDTWPAVPTRFVLCSEDRFFPPEFMRRVVAERLAIVPDEISAGHCVALSHPEELAELLIGYTATGRSRC